MNHHKSCDCLKSGFKKKKDIFYYPKNESIILRTPPLKVYDCRIESAFPEFACYMYM